MSEKTSIDMKMFWYTNMVVIPEFVTIITTVDKEGNVNAAPYSLGVPYSVTKKKPQILFLMRKNSHTCINAQETREFVVNFPSSTYLTDVMETAQFMPRGENELDHTRFTTIASQKVTPPSIKECYQHLECRLNEVIEDDMQTRLIGDIVEIVVDSKLTAMNRYDRIKAADPPVYIGDERRKDYFFGKIGKIEQLAFQIPEKGERRKTIRTNIPWEEAALTETAKIPIAIREMVIEFIEEEAKKGGDDRVTYELYKKIEEEYAPKEYTEKIDHV